METLSPIVPLEITEEQWKNLAAMADALESGVIPEESFNMGRYSTHEFPRHAKLIRPLCETVGCFIGNTPYVFTEYFANLPDIPLYERPWSRVSLDLFGCHDGRRYPAGYYMFSGDWAIVDNTIQGAVKRVRQVIEHKGIPRILYRLIENRGIHPSSLDMTRWDEMLQIPCEAEEE